MLYVLYLIFGVVATIMGYAAYDQFINQDYFLGTMSVLASLLSIGIIILSFLWERNNLGINLHKRTDTIHSEKEEDLRMSRNIDTVKKPIYKRVWFIVIVAILVIGGIGSALGGGKDDKGNDTPVADNSNDKEKTDNKEEEKKEEPKEENSMPTFGSTIEFDGLEITIGDSYEFLTLENQFSDLDGSDVIVVPATVKNISDKKNGLNMFYVKFYGSKGVELDSVYTYFSDNNDILFNVSSDSLRPEASTEANFHFLYDGDGTYYITLNNFTSEVEIELQITKQ